MSIYCCFKVENKNEQRDQSYGMHVPNTTESYSNMCCAYCCLKEKNQPVGNSESEGILSDNGAIHGSYCVTMVVVAEMGLRR